MQVHRMPHHRCVGDLQPDPHARRHDQVYPAVIEDLAVEAPVIPHHAAGQPGAQDPRRSAVRQRRRIGVVVKLRHPDDSPPYVVRWLDDGHEALVFPGPDARIESRHEMPA